MGACLLWGVYTLSTFPRRKRIIQILVSYRATLEVYIRKEFRAMLRIGIEVWPHRSGAAEYA